MFLGIDHVVIATADPEAAATELAETLGLEATGGGRHDALGTFNRLAWLGDSYVELIGIFDQAIARGSWLGAPTMRTLQTGGGLVTWAIATDDLERDASALRAAGADLSGPIDSERRRADGARVRWRLAKPPRLGPLEPPFLLEHDLTAAEWMPADRAARAEQRHPIGGPVRLETLELLVDHVPDMTRRFARTVGLRFRPSLAGGGSRDADIGRQAVRLRPRRGTWPQLIPTLAAPPAVPAAPATIHLAARGLAERREVEILSCRWVVRPTV